MLIIPYQTRFSARSVPALTLALILVNAIVFFFLQSRDEAIYRAAFAQYASSELPQIELPRYRTWLLDRTDADALDRLSRLRSIPAQSGVLPALLLMQSDADFMRELRAGRVIRTDEPVYAQWRDQRSRFESMLAQAFAERYALKTGSGQPWRLLTYQFLHGDFGHWLGNMIVLLLAGPFAEAALGRVRFLLGYVASGAAAGAVFSLLSGGTLIGASGAIAGAMAMVAVLYWTRRVPVFYWIVFYFDTARIPALALLPVWIVNELYQWAAAPGAPVAYAAHLGGFAFGALIAWLLRPRDAKRVDRVLDEAFADEHRAERRSSLLAQAQAAAARLDTRRAAQLYRELVEMHPDNLEFLIAYFNIALLGHDEKTLADAALRILWQRRKHAPEDLRKVFLQMSQPKVLQALPVDEQLRLARRLVRSREHNAALQVLDRLLGDDNLRSLYGRQIADCLLGLFTTYTRYGLKQQAETVRQRLSKYFPSPSEIGGLPPKAQPPITIRATTRASTRGGPDTLRIDLSH
jgi:membrane associated rhomboid family serine protease